MGAYLKYCLRREGLIRGRYFGNAHEAGKTKFRV